MAKLDLLTKQGKGEINLVSRDAMEERCYGSRPRWTDVLKYGERIVNPVHRVCRRCSRQHRGRAALSLSGSTNASGASAVGASTEAAIFPLRSEKMRRKGQAPSR